MFLSSVLCGFGFAWLFQRYSDKAAMQFTVNRMVAHVLEFRLFIDEPRLIFRAQRDLFRANLHLLRLLIRPAAAVAVPSLFVFLLLDGFFGHAPLPLGKPVVVTAQLRVGSSYTPPCADTGGVRIPRFDQVSWRVIPTSKCQGGLWKIPRGYFWNTPVKWIQVPYPTARLFGQPWWTLSLLGFTIGGLVYGKVNG